jgi:hypothetical protein
MTTNQPKKKMYLTYLYATHIPNRFKKFNPSVKLFIERIQYALQETNPDILEKRDNDFKLNPLEQYAIDNHLKAVKEKKINFVRYKFMDQIIYIPIKDVESLKWINAYLNPNYVEAMTYVGRDVEGEISNNLREKRRNFRQRVDIIKSKIKSKFKTARNDIKSRYKTFKKKYNITRSLRTHRLSVRDAYKTAKSKIKGLLSTRKPNTASYMDLDTQNQQTRRQKISSAFRTAKRTIKSALPSRKKTEKTKKTIRPITNNNNNRPTNSNTKGPSFFNRIRSVLPSRSRRTKTNFSRYTKIGHNNGL